MAEVLSPQSATASAPKTATTSTTTSLSPRSHSPGASIDSHTATSLSQPQSIDPQHPHTAPQHSPSNSQHSTAAQMDRTEYPAFESTLSYALVRDFAYPAFHPLHYGAVLEPSRPSTPTSEWNADRRHSDPMEALNNNLSSLGGWSAGPWGGDGGLYGDPEEDDGEGGLAALPSTSFDSTGEQADFGDDDSSFKKGKHRKSKSYSNMADFERGRRRESARRSRGDAGDGGIFWFQGQQNDPRRSRGSHGAVNDLNGGRRDSPFSNTTTLPNSSFHNNNPGSNHDANNSMNDDEEEMDEDDNDHIPLDTEPHSLESPQRNSMGPEDEELFAGPSLALYSFEPENSNELRLVEGQEIMVSYRHGQGWLVASDPSTGEQGLVPEAYVRLIADMPNYDPEKGEFVDLDEYDEDTEEDGEGMHRFGEGGVSLGSEKAGVEPEDMLSTAHERNEGDGHGSARGAMGQEVS